MSMNSGVGNNSRGNEICSDISGENVQNERVSDIADFILFSDIILVISVMIMKEYLILLTSTLLYSIEFFQMICYISKYRTLI
jgi:hypothetical protein